MVSAPLPLAKREAAYELTGNRPPPPLAIPYSVSIVSSCRLPLQYLSDGAAFDLLEDIHVISCSADSRMAVLTFVRPDTRDAWTNRSFRFPFGQITLRATDAMDQVATQEGLDDAGLALMYSIHLLGKPDMALSDVHAVATELCGGLPILDVFLLEPTCVKALDTHEWKIVLHDTEAPTGIAQLRCLNITQGDSKFQLGVHQPRLAKHHPCSVCLGLGHFRNKCKLVGDAKKLTERRAKFERELVLPPTAVFQMNPTATTLEEYRVQMHGVRQLLAPDLAAKEADERTKAEAAAAAAIAEEQVRAEKQRVEEANAEAQRLRKEKKKEKARKSPVHMLSAALARKPAVKKSKEAVANRAPQQ